MNFTQLLNQTESTMNKFHLNNDCLILSHWIEKDSRIEFFASLNYYFPVYHCNAAVNQSVLYKALYMQYKYNLIWLHLY